MDPDKKPGVLLKKILIGRDFPFFDKFLFWVSKGKYSGWLLGNKIRSFLYGKKNYVSNEPFIFIGGFPRSGTTLLRAILEQHEKIASPGTEIMAFQDIREKWRLKKSFGLSGKEIQKLNKNEDLIKFSEELAKIYKKKKGKEFVLLKQPKYVLLIDDTFKYFPKSKIIHIIRDGRDCTMSQRYYLLPKERYEWPYEWCCRQWVTYIKRGKRYRGDKRYIEIKYEDLVENPFRTMKKVTNFLGLKEIDKKKIQDYHKKVNVSKHPDHPEIAEGIKKKQINKWINKMSKEDKQIFKKIAGKTFEELGYKY